MKFEVKNHLLYLDGKQVTYKASPNKGGPKKSNRFIVIHYDGSPNSTGAVGWMIDPRSKVSAELHITREGNVTQLVPFNITAWHAGESSWKGVIGLNSHSIGIELQNSGNQEYTRVQLDVLAEVCKALVAEYHEEEIVGHSDIAPGRKVDPGKQFPMEWLRSEVFDSPSKVKSQKTVSDLNLRSGAGTNFKIVSVLPKGTEVNILDTVGDWSHVFTCGSKLIGYVSSKYLSKP